jgi:riboflavin synthase
MFTGIIESIGTVQSLQTEGDNLHIEVESTLSPELKVDQSVSHNGVCLTVTEIQQTRYYVTAIRETLQLTNLGQLKVGDALNLERCMQMNGRLDGHIVQGHVDTRAELLSIIEEAGSWRLTLQFPSAFSGMLVSKGSVCLNGISLTVVNPLRDTFEVAIIPYTWEHTNLHRLQAGNLLNVEFDILGKYVQRYLQLTQ